MANVTTLALGGASTGTIGSQAPGPQKWTHEIDVAEAVAAGLATTNYVVAVNIPADTYFTLEQVEVVEALVLGGTDRVDIGDSADDDEFVSNATTYTAGTNFTLLKNNGSSGNVYTAADTLRVKFTGAALTSGKLRLAGFICNMARAARAEAPDL